MMKTAQLYEIFSTSQGVNTDTRKLASGEIYFALKGENFDGNAFASQAIDKGAAYAVIDDPLYLSGARCILVDDVLETLQALATYHRDRFDIPVLAITGSNGKTTTKELIDAILSAKFRTHCTVGNYNNHIGLPLTILGADTDTEFLILEMGANHQGEIQLLCEIGHPNYGIITNIGEAHLEGFGGIEGVARGKTELFRYLDQNSGTAFVNLDDKRVTRHCPSGMDKVTFTSKRFSALDHTGHTLKLHDTGSGIQLDTRLVGAYNISNIAAAYCIGTYFGVDHKLIARAIEEYDPIENRSQIIRKGKTDFVMDAYNANPSSMTHSLESFGRHNAQQKIVILGEMLELGKVAADRHAEILDASLDLEFEKVITVGKGFKNPSDERDISWFLDVEALGQYFLDHSFWIGKTILLKGSRRNKLENLVDLINDQ